MRIRIRITDMVSSTLISTLCCGEIITARGISNAVHRSLFHHILHRHAHSAQQGFIGYAVYLQSIPNYLLWNLWIKRYLCGYTLQFYRAHCRAAGQWISFVRYPLHHKLLLLRIIIFESSSNL